MTKKENKLTVEKIADGYKHVCVFTAVFAGLTIALMMISTTMDASARYILNRPIPGVFELNEVLLVICVYMGMAWTQIEKGHIRVTAFLTNRSEKTQILFNILAWTVTFIFLSILSTMSAVGAWESYKMLEFRWGSVQMPIWWAKALVPIGCWMMNIQLIIDIWKEIEVLKGNLPGRLA